jgi:ABC-type lipoprotein export system ATPase subunit
MQLNMQGVVPAHLQERLRGHRSEVWNTDVTMAAGACVRVQAPSGTGKTTLMHMLYGLRSDYTGRISWGGKDIAAMDDAGWARQRRESFSVIFQDLRLFPSLTALENIEVKRLLTNSVAAAKVQEWMSRLGIADKADALAATLSYGEQQRVAIIRALVQPFGWLLMDEPFSHLDVENRQKAIALIQEVVQQQQAGMILAELDSNDYFDYTQILLM